MKEQQYQSKIVKYLESRGAYVIKVVAASKKGIPDVIACYKGQFIAIEVKTPLTRSNTSKLQEYNLDKIAEAGGQSGIAVDIDDINPMLNRIDNDQ